MDNNLDIIKDYLTSNHSSFKDELLSYIDEMTTIYDTHIELCKRLKEKILINTFDLVVVGQFKRGKTSIINALLGANILPVSVIPLTSIVTIIIYGKELKIKVYFNDGKIVEIESQSLIEYITEKGNPKNIKNVNKVVIAYPSDYLKDGIRLIDTPGVGSIYQHNTEVAYEYLPNADAVVFLLSVDQPLSQAELDFLDDVKEYSCRIFFIMNKIDYLSEIDLRECISFTEKTLKEKSHYSSFDIYPVSAKLALEGKLTNNSDLLFRSNFPFFEEKLKRFLVYEKGNILIISVANNLLRILSEAILKAELEVKSIKIPLEELNKKLLQFEKKRKEIKSEKRDFEILFEGEIKQIIEGILDPDLYGAKKELFDTLLPEIEEFYNKNKSLSTNELRKALEEFIVYRVMGYYEIFRKNEDSKISKIFENLCKRFTSRINDLIDSLLHYSSELFSVSFESFKAEVSWNVSSSFYYKFKDESLMIEALENAFTLLLPSFLSKSIIFKGMKKYLIEMIDRQSGRIRWSFVERLTNSKLKFRREMFKKIDETIGEIMEAINKGIEQKYKNEEEILKKEKEINENLTKLYGLKDKVIFMISSLNQ
jgi:ribosome biogenesis GTPase A